MLNNFNSLISDSFKKAVLNTARKEVNNIVDTSVMTDEQKEAIETFFVQPLFWSKLYFFAGIYFQFNETDITSVIMNPNISDDDKKYFLNTLLLKLGIDSTGDINKDAQLILNKLFYTNEIKTSKVSSLLEHNEIKAIQFNPNLIHFCNELSQYAYDNFKDLYLAENLKSLFYISEIADKTVSFDKINEYFNTKQSTYHRNSVAIYTSDATIVKNSQNIYVPEGDIKTVSIDGMFFDIKILADNKENVKVSFAKNNFIGNEKKEYLLTLIGPVNVTIELYGSEISNDIISEINSTFKEYDCKVMAPFKIEAEITVNNENNLNKLYELTNFKDYDYFFEKIKTYANELILNNNMIADYVANIFLNPFVFKSISFNYLGIPFNETKITSNMNKDNCLIKIAKIIVRETGNVYSF